MGKYSKPVLDTLRPKLFQPTVARDEIGRPGFVSSVSLTSVSDTNIESTASFRYDPPGAGIRSTQQINTDFSKFHNHTFFHSAQAKVNIAFDKVVNYFPFDGTKQELENYLDNLIFM